MTKLATIVLLACFVGTTISPGTATASPAGEDRPLRPKRPKERGPDKRPQPPAPEREWEPRGDTPAAQGTTVAAGGLYVIESYEFCDRGLPYAASLEDANLGFTLMSVIANATFAIAGQTQEVVAGFGVVFGLTSLLFAARPGSDYRAVDFVAGAASLALAYFNMASSPPTGRFTDLSQSTSRVGAQSRSVGVFITSF